MLGWKSALRDPEQRCQYYTHGCEHEIQYFPPLSLSALHTTRHHENPGTHLGLCKDPPDVSLKNAVL